VTARTFPGAGVAERDAVPRAAAPRPAGPVPPRGRDQPLQLGDGGEGAGDLHGEGLHPAPVPVVNHPHAGPRRSATPLPAGEERRPTLEDSAPARVRCRGCRGRGGEMRRRRGEAQARGVVGFGASESAAVASPGRRCTEAEAAAGGIA
jgi:hypothetical protein